MTRVVNHLPWTALLGPSAEHLQTRVQQHLVRATTVSGTDAWSAFLRNTGPDRLWAPFSSGIREGTAPGGTIPPWNRYFPDPGEGWAISGITVVLMEKMDALLAAVTRIGELLARVFGVDTPDSIPQAGGIAGGTAPVPGTGPVTRPGLDAETPAAPPPGTPAAPASAGDGGRSAPSDGFGEALLTRLGDRMHRLETQLNTIDPSTPEGQVRLMRLQNEMQRVTQMIALISEIWKARHDATMGVIRNMR